MADLSDSELAGVIQRHQLNPVEAFVFCNDMGIPTGSPPHGMPSEESEKRKVRHSVWRKIDGAS